MPLDATMNNKVSRNHMKHDSIPTAMTAREGVSALSLAKKNMIMATA